MTCLNFFISNYDKIMAKLWQNIKNGFTKNCETLYFIGCMK